ncbi:hypothetical protein BFS14_14585 [Serratia fonticola]|uniref:hypothetical protein n=1 Tax=Serratia fonticola TaxID=47917 RepID=UPI0008FD0C80|nr:hypothetical protein [Serratia fonticola]OIX95589.1 hypothetical protein BFS14_14585 [Serratia fonticola]QCR62101.1 hypothetical protein FD644_17845 [Serratia fonticola]
MLEDYPLTDDTDARIVKRRILAVNAALEIIKASAAAPSAYTGYQKVDHDCKYAIAHLDELADAIQAAIDEQ